MISIKISEKTKKNQILINMLVVALFSILAIYSDISNKIDARLLSMGLGIYVVIINLLVIKGRWYDSSKIKKNLKIKLLLPLLVVYGLALFNVISVVTLIIIFSIILLLLLIIDLIYFNKTDI